MADIVTPEVRSRMMAAIRGKNTRPEMVLRKRLFALGLRYQLHPKGLPGRPDLAFPRWKAAVFVHGCFWHRHRGCRFATVPASNAAFWDAKFEANRARDARVQRLFKAEGWRSLTVWECQIRKDPDKVAAKVCSWVRSRKAKRSGRSGAMQRP